MECNSDYGGGDGRGRTIQAATNAVAIGCLKTIWDYPIALARRYQAEILDRIIAFLQDFNPDVVLIRRPLDINADHRLIAHISRHVMGVVDDISMGINTHLHYPTAKEIYAFQAGIVQTCHFIPDLLVTADVQITEERFVSGWRNNVHAKSAYWSGLPGKPAKPRNFLALNYHWMVFS
ncbi:MAG: hypothetical protein GX946_06395 [Oligosphaeraceae bacterium]|nr:hypothetical protein [Oligosphaeraceae bacterium]